MSFDSSQALAPDMSAAPDMSKREDQAGDLMSAADRTIDVGQTSPDATSADTVSVDARAMPAYPTCTFHCSNVNPCGTSTGDGRGVNLTKDGLDCFICDPLQGNPGHSAIDTALTECQPQTNGLFVRDCNECGLP